MLVYFVSRCPLHAATALFLLSRFFHCLCCPGAHRNWNQAFNLFSHSWLTHAWLVRSNFFPAHSCYHYIPNLLFLRHIEYRWKCGGQFEMCRSLQTERKWCAVHVSRLKAEVTNEKIWRLTCSCQPSRQSNGTILVSLAAETFEKTALENRLGVSFYFYRAATYDVTSAMKSFPWGKSIFIVACLLNHF